MQIQHDAQRRQQEDTDRARQNLPPAIGSRIPQGGVARLNQNTHTVVVRDPRQGRTVVINSQTGQVGMSYSKAVGIPQARPRNGITRQTDGSVVTERGPGGYQRVHDTSHGTEIVRFRGIETRRTIVNQRTTIINRTVIVNNQTFYIHGDRPYIRTFNPFYGQYQNVYKPQWWGDRDFMNDHWADRDDSHHFYGEFFAYGSHVPEGYRSLWWREHRFQDWDDRPLVWNNWDRYRWGWRQENFYPGYYAPAPQYRHFGYWIADYWFQRELETERAERLAAEAYQDYVQEERLEQEQNALALERADNAVPDYLMDQLAQQVEQMVAAIEQGVELFASNLINDGHLFVVDQTMSETTVIDGTTYDCKLRAGDLLTRDTRFDLDVETLYQDDGVTPQVDEVGNLMTTTYVPMKVVASKRNSCVRGSTVVVQLSALQEMADEERARVQEGVENGVSLGIQP